MNSLVSDDFRERYARLPGEVQSQARRAYRLWKNDPTHPGIQFKRVHTREPIWSARIGSSWRALGYREGDTILWIWIGSHAEYDAILARS